MVTKVLPPMMVFPPKLKMLKMALDSLLQFCCFEIPPISENRSPYVNRSSYNRFVKDITPMFFAVKASRKISA